MARSTLYAFERDTLEAIERAGGLKGYEMPDASGWPAGSCAAATYRMRGLGLVESKYTVWRLTERGKIVLAITLGKEMRARLKRNAA